jgi:hypothetical protein
MHRFFVKLQFLHKRCCRHKLCKRGHCCGFRRLRKMYPPLLPKLLPVSRCPGKVLALCRGGIISYFIRCRCGGNGHLRHLDVHVFGTGLGTGACTGDEILDEIYESAQVVHSQNYQVYTHYSDFQNDGPPLHQHTSKV